MEIKGISVKEKKRNQGKERIEEEKMMKYERKKKEGTQNKGLYSNFHSCIDPLFIERRQKEGKGKREKEGKEKDETLKRE